MNYIILKILNPFFLYSPSMHPPSSISIFYILTYIIIYFILILIIFMDWYHKCSRNIWLVHCFRKSNSIRNKMLIISNWKIQWVMLDGKEHSLVASRLVIKILVEAKMDGYLLALFLQLVVDKIKPRLKSKVFLISWIRRILVDRLLGVIYPCKLGLQGGMITL